MIYRLIILNGPQKGERITVDTEPITIGRGDECDVVLSDTEMALRHARLEQRGSELFVHDLGTMNKIILNKHEVQDCRLKHGDVIELGRTRLLVQAIVQAEVHTAPDAPPAMVRRGRKRKGAIAASLLLIAGGTFALIQTTQPGPATDPVVPAIRTEVMANPTAPLEKVVVTGESTPPVDDELRRIRADLHFIQQHLLALNTSPALLAENTEPATAKAEAREPDREPEEIKSVTYPQVNDVESVMKAVRSAIAEKDYSEADQMLEHLQLEYPDYLPAYQVRAEMLEEWGMPAKARDQWTAILQRTAESDIYRRAVSERIRLGRSESQTLVSAHEAVRIESLDQVRFPETAEYDELRTIKIQLTYDRTLGPIDPQGVRLLVYFFEQDLDTQRISLSSIQPFVEANLSALRQETRDMFTFSVNYVAPKGYYQRDHNTSRQRYFGFIARLHYFDQLVDEQARPPKLLEPAILEAAGLARHTADLDGFFTPLLRPQSN
jgi:predicted component of type VI protein secretion system